MSLRVVFLSGLFFVVGLEACSAGGGADSPGATGGSSNAGTGGAPGQTGGAGSGAGGDIGSGGEGAGGIVNAGGTPSSGGAPPVFDAGTDPLRNQVPAGQVCDRFATIQCAGEAACCSNPGRTFDQCKAVQKDACVNQAYLDAISLSAVAGYDMTRAEGAFTEFERLASICDGTIAAWAATAAGLRGIAQGTLDPGGNCTPPNIFNKAEAASYLAACKFPDTTACLPGLTTWSCAARGGVSTPCFTDVNCVDGLYCDNPNLVPTGSFCKARKADGSPCALSNECASLMCRGSECVPATKDVVYCIAN